MVAQQAPSLVRARGRDRTAEYGTIEVVPRAEHVRDFGKSYASGQHVTYLGPTRRGKTRQMRENLKVTANPDRKAVVLHGKIKGRDPEIPEMSKDLKMRQIDEYPPDWRPGDRNRNGYILVPLQHPADTVAQENGILVVQFRKAIHACYSDVKHDTILVVDESHQAQETLKLKADIEGPLMRGAPQCSVWNGIQRGRFVSYHCYDAPEYLYIFYDPDISNQKRYSEIGGVDPDYIRHVTKGLKRKTIKTNGGRDTATISESLFIKRGGPYLCVVDMD